MTAMRTCVDTQYFAVCYNVLQCVAVCCGVLLCGVVCCGTLQYDAV